MVNDTDDPLAFSGIRFLTNLTQLKILSERWFFDIEPFTELQKIEELSIPWNLMKGEGLLFPSLTHLTCLDFKAMRHDAGMYRGGFLELLSPYASSLSALTVSFSDIILDEQLIQDWSLFRYFTKLESVCIAPLDEEETVAFHSSLRSLISITDLTVEMKGNSVQLVENLEAMKCLRSLRLRCGRSRGSDHSSSLLSVLTQLTLLHVDDSEDFSFVEHLTGLVDFKCDVYNHHRNFGDDDDAILPDGLTRLSRLERLASIHCVNQQLPFCLRQLKKLKYLELTNNQLDHRLLEAIAELGQLTGLHWWSDKETDPSGLQFVQRLTNLEKLHISLGSSIDYRNCVAEWNLPRLKYLELALPFDHISTFSNDNFGGFPCLRKVKYLNMP